ncbi:MAG: peptidylprolyl isomerase, partial [Spirochaetes bacterium]|nr:peptidylprolyl isomerase [Spirochaetota bacterium]
GGKFEDEVTPEIKFDRKGLLAMANSGPSTNGSQFFINVVDTSWLDGKHTVFGAITDGIKIVDKISNVPVDSKKKPKTDIKIIDIVLM